jgi:ribosomal protein L35
MPKLKTHKATSKRFRPLKGNRFMKRKNGQDHFKAKETGELTRRRRGDIVLDNIRDSKNLKKFIPYEK